MKLEPFCWYLHSLLVITDKRNTHNCVVKPQNNVPEASLRDYPSNSARSGNMPRIRSKQSIHQMGSIAYTKRILIETKFLIPLSPVRILQRNRYLIINHEKEIPLVSYSTLIAVNCSSDRLRELAFSLDLFQNSKWTQLFIEITRPLRLFVCVTHIISGKSTNVKELTS